MRRAALLSATTLSLILALQPTRAVGCDECARLVLPSVWRSQGCKCDGLRSYVLRNLGLCHTQCVRQPVQPPAPTYIQVTRSPRDFWMLH